MSAIAPVAMPALAARHRDGGDMLTA
jgi:hypothetical protein